MATFRPNPASPIPNNPFSAPLNPYVVGPWWPMPVGTGLGVDLIPGVLYSTGGGGGSVVNGTFPIIAVTSGSGITVSIAPSTITNSGAVQLTNSLSNTSQTLALTAAAGKSLQDQINALILGTTAGIILIGTINGSTGLVSTIVNSTYPGFTVGSPLPAAAPANTGTFVLVSTPGTMTPPNGVSTVTAEGDWWYSDGSTWTLIPVGVSGGSALPATPTALGTVYACTPDSYPSGCFPVVTLGRSNVNPYTARGSLIPLGGHVLLGFNTQLSYTGLACGYYGSILIGNSTCTRDNSIAIGGETCINVGGGIAIGNYSCVARNSFVCCCGGIAIGNQLCVQSGTVALVATRCQSLDYLCRNAYGARGVIIGSRDGFNTGSGSPEDIVDIGARYGNYEIPDRTIAIGLRALSDSLISITSLSVGQFASPLAIGTNALSGSIISTSSTCSCGIYNTAVGQGAGTANCFGSYNTYFGAAAGGYGSSRSTVIGALASSSSVNSDDSVAIGARAAVYGVGAYSIVIGSNASNSGTVGTGVGNIIIGSYVNSNITSTQDHNLVLGAGCGFNPPNLNGSCQLALGLSLVGAATSCYWLTGCPDMNIKPGAGIVDKNGSSGTNGQVLASTGANSVEWSGGNSLPAGALMNFVQSTAPSGWLVANGDTVPNGTGTVQGVTANFSSLYAALASAFGGPGKLPDMRGMFTRGWDSAGGVARNCDPGRALGSQQGFAIENITGSICGISETFGAVGTPSIATAGNALYRSASLPNRAFTPITTDTSNTGTVCFNAALSVSTAAETRPVNIAILPCIKY